MSDAIKLGGGVGAADPCLGLEPPLHQMFYCSYEFQV